MPHEPHIALTEDSSIDPEDLSLAQGRGALHPCRILVVDDDALVRARFSALLKAAQFDVELAASGEEALHILSATHCHIVLTDWQMPDMDGLALCRHVRADQNNGYVYVVIFTVRGAKQDMLAGLGAGADDYVIKGAPIDEILARLEVGRRITQVDHSLRTSNRENRRLALTDPLTGAYNLRYLTRHLPHELARAQRYGHSLAILSCDIDEFKLVNDRFGHQAGDAVLRAFVERSECCIRKASDWLARMGGDEFMIVLPETTVQGANLVAQKLRRIVALHPVPTFAGAVRFTVSIGVTAAGPNHELDSVTRIEALFRAADRGLYSSKNRGRDRTTVTAMSH
jgi:diguanylate cyclase (GGDEF)-like protein